MSGYKNLIVLFLLSLLFFSGCSQKRMHYTKDHKFFEQEDQYILHALELKQNQEFIKSKDLYFKLYTKTNKLEYFREYMRLALKLSSFEEILQAYNDHQNYLGNEYQFISRVYITALIGLNKKELAVKEAEYLIDYETNALNYEILANAYFIDKQYEKSKKYFRKSFELSGNSDTLIKAADIIYTYLHKEQQAIDMLEDYNDKMNCDLKVCDKLLRIYQERKDIDNIIKTLKRSVERFKEDKNFIAYAKVANMLLIYLEKKDINLAIEFLEQNDVSQLKLFTLYKQTNQKGKALSLLKKIYDETNHIELLGQIAILEFEMADKKEDVIDEIVKKLKNVTSVIDSHFYQNFLGYLLIDFEIDVDNGMKLVKKALEKQPNNIAYIDSMAWGYYKKNDCKNSYKYMKQVVDEIGLKDEEIIHHWNKIKECEIK